jgi:hypothetical protein
MKKRVVFICQTECYGGSEVIVLDLLRQINYEKNEVYVVSIADVFSNLTSQLGLPVRWVRSAALPKGTPLALFVSWFRFLVKLRPDEIILANAFRNFSLPAVLAASAAAQGSLYMLEHSEPPEPPQKSSRHHFGFLPGLGLWWYRAVWPLRARAYVAKRTLVLSECVKQGLQTTVTLRRKSRLLIMELTQFDSRPPHPTFGENCARR